MGSIKTMEFKTIPAGLTHATILPDMDFETYSEAGFYWDGPLNRWRAPDGFPKGKPGLPSIGAAKYAEHTSTEIISLAYDLKDGRGAFLWVPGMDPPTHLFRYLQQPGALIEAYNVLFEYFIWHYVGHLKLGWPPLDLSILRCAKAKAAAWGLPNNLDKTAIVLHSYGY
jgi:hypothetical protein